MERLAAESVLRSMLDDVIRIQGLDDLRQFHESDFFDEAPFFSRASDVAFLERLGRPAAERLLIEFATDYLDRILSSDPTEADFFAAVTISEVGRGQLFIPSLFVCNGRVRERLGSRLVLEPVTTRLGKKIEELIVSAQKDKQFEALEDRLTVPRHPRVFIGPRQPQGPKSLRLRDLSRSGGPRNGYSGDDRPDVYGHGL